MRAFWSRTVAVLGASALVALFASNVVLHDRLERSTDESWRAMQRRGGDALLPTRPLQARHGLYFELRRLTRGGFDVRIPENWDGSSAQANFGVAIEGPLLTIARASSVVSSTGSRFGPTLDLEEIVDVADSAGMQSSSGRSRYNNRSDWYTWAIIVQDEYPIAMRVFADEQLNYLMVDSRIEISELDGSAD